MEQMVSNRVWFVRCDVVYGTDVWSRWCRFVNGGEVRGRIWNTCMEQIVPCMEYVVPVLYETGGDRQYM